MIDSRLRKCAYLLADKHVRELPDEALVGNSPQHYGPAVTDDHRTFMWNAMVDHYLELPQGELFQLYTRHVVNKEPIVKCYAYGEVSEELAQLLDTITEAIWGEAEQLPPVRIRLQISENTD